MSTDLVHLAKRLISSENTSFVIQTIDLIFLRVFYFITSKDIDLSQGGR
jgi:hypothetical protein